MRSVTVIDVPDVGNGIQTKYRYYCIGSNFKSWTNSKFFDASQNYYYKKSKLHEFNSDLKYFYPNVFANEGEGIPFYVTEHIASETSYGDSDAAHFGYFLLVMGTAGTAPFLRGKTTSKQIQFSINSPSRSSDFRLCSRQDEASSMFSPFSLLFFHGTPSFEEYDPNRSKIFKESKVAIGAQSVNSENEAIAYGIAYQLKKMEENGQITDADLKRVAKQREDEMNSFFKSTPHSSRSLPASRHANSFAHVQNARYSLESFTWEDGSDFSAIFKVKMHGECSIDSFFAIRQAFDAHVRNAYLQTHPSADSRHLQIEVRPNLENGMISGRVTVLTIVPVTLTYDANTRRGKLAVRFNAGQAEEARTWIRKNIETLARDKNIALMTGTLLPEATYYSLGEKIEGNVMEIEFRTE